MDPKTAITDFRDVQKVLATQKRNPNQRRRWKANHFHQRHRHLFEQSNQTNVGTETSQSECARSPNCWADIGTRRLALGIERLARNKCGSRLRSNLCQRRSLLGRIRATWIY
ncbi:hypothetical protein DAPPUDRAFT_306177 [Daphnia pulex]|uniref:Uncharacterized protein n=1 Tax=Daphnia pulex TaxID=6669 RepID=E9GVM9_DAPPU|nr:hypothetical protein DAPPUDRAFT_306177 [Daphnia pulex]|eukprot:EFX76441.1 hypothetical protein DAPPUDRAFT_306177 [Daphnia pulex]